jgi:Tol biopolymer transport system component
MKFRIAILPLLLVWPVLAGGQPIPAAPVIERGEAEFLSRTRQLTYDGLRSGEGYFSPDGRWLIFQSEREPNNPFYQIYLLDLETGDTTRLSPGTGKTTCAFFRPDSDEVLFSSTHHDPEALEKQREELEFRASGQTRRYSWDYDERMEVYLAKRDGTGLRRLTRSQGYDAEASFSPDGTKIVFTSLRHAYPPEKLTPGELPQLELDPSHFGEIYIMNADGSDPRRLTFAPGYDGGPFFSPDGERIVWRRFNEKGLADVYTMNLDGSEQRRLTDFNCVSWAPFFHPSGEYVIFTANKFGFGNFELFLVDRLGEREPVRVTFTDGFDGLPVFSPEGQRLSWTSNRGADGRSQLFLADWNHEAALAALAQAPGRRGVREAVQDSGFSDAAPVGRTISSESLREHVAFLASEDLEGRMTGSAGIRKAADYLAAQFEEMNLQGLGDEDSYFREFEFNAGGRIIPHENEFSIQLPDEAPSRFEVETDFRPLSFTANGEVEGEVAFAGYGLSAPAAQGGPYDSYAGLDVTNKIVLVFRYVPEEIPASRRQELTRYSSLRYKAMMARERGAKAILIVTGPTAPNAGALAPLTFDSSLAGSGIVAASINLEAAEMLFAAAGKDLKAIQTALDSENPHAEASFLIPNATVRLKMAVERNRKTDRNVIGYLPPAPGPEPVEYIMVGAHYDHLGFGETGTRGHSHGDGEIHPGADDNASGSAAVLELAAALSAERAQSPEKFARGIIFAFWSGEELGLIGSSHFAENPPVPLERIKAYLNFDMVGRLRDNQLILQGIGSSSDWKRLLERRNVAAGFNLVLQEDPYLPTDVTAFYPKGIPVLSFFTGSHEDYHRPTDTADRVEYEGLERITQFARALISDLIQAPGSLEYVKVERTQRAGSRDGLRLYLGTIPDYASNLEGVKIAGTTGGSPAEGAGLKPGDIIVEFAGRKVVNIYDYTHALDAAKAGEETEIVILREGKRVALTIVPAVRK